MVQDKRCVLEEPEWRKAALVIVTTKQKVNGESTEKDMLSQDTASLARSHSLITSQLLYSANWVTFHNLHIWGHETLGGHSRPKPQQGVRLLPLSSHRNGINVTEILKREKKMKNWKNWLPFCASTHDNLERRRKFSNGISVSFWT